jgi:hypothetical protein
LIIADTHIYLFHGCIANILFLCISPISHRSHRSSRAAANNPHGFSAQALAKLRAIADPAQREKAERRLIRKRNREWALSAGEDEHDERLGASGV